MMRLVASLRRSIATRLFAAIFLSFFSVSVVISIGLMTDVYLRARGELQRELEFLQGAFHDPLADNVWSFDMQGLQGVLDGMVRLPVIEGVQVADATTGRILGSSGVTAPDRSVVGFTFPLRHPHAGFDATDDIIARATIYRPANALIVRAWPSIALILVSALVKTFLLFVLFYVFSRHILRRPLVRLADGVDHLSRRLEDLRPLHLAGDSGEELEHVEAAVNRLVVALNEKQAERDSYATALETARNELEQRVQTRTAELEQALIEAEDANRAKSRFLAMVSHELRTPLNAVLGFSEMIRDAYVAPLDARYQSYAGDINAAGQHLLQIINDMLDLTRIEAGRMQVDPEWIGVDRLVASVRQLLGGVPEARQIALEAETGGVTRVWADETAVRQMLINLVGNALKFTEPGGTVLIAFARADDGVTVSVSDTGIGMDDLQVEEARRMFVQIGDKRARGGLGLGLPIVEGLIRLHGGTMAIDSMPGHGTTVTLRFPDPVGDG